MCWERKNKSFIPTPGKRVAPELPQRSQEISLLSREEVGQGEVGWGWGLGGMRCGVWGLGEAEKGTVGHR